MAHDLPQNAIWQALETSHSHLALIQGHSRRYPAAVAPFAAVDAPTPGALADLADLLAPEESVYLLSDRPLRAPGLLADGFLAGLQMIFPLDAPLPPQLPDFLIEQLDCHNASEMLDLITVAFPGFFRPETCRMGPSFGVRDPGGALIAMGGNRLALHPWYEISGLCSHPSRAGQGLGTAMLVHILTEHRARGVASFLHVGADNQKAIALYLRVGFRVLRHIELHRVRRAAL